MRTFVAIAISLYWVVGLARACDMQLTNSSERVVEYTTRALDCLQNPPSDFYFDEEREDAFVRLINEERLRVGLKPLQVRQMMRPAARYHSLDMGVNGFFAHISPQGSTPDFRLFSFDRTLIALASFENVAKMEMQWSCRNSIDPDLPCRSTTPPPSQFEGVVQKLHTSLMKSPGHRANILSVKATHVSVGVAMSSSGIYVTQVFATKIGEFVQPLPLQLAAGSTVSIKPELDDFRTAKLAIYNGSELIDMRGRRLPKQVMGDITLVVRGKRGILRRRDQQLKRSTDYSYFLGPRLTISLRPENQES
ncbi:MAG: CAP domain-containing protein [Pseudomonadota bacterium]